MAEEVRPGRPGDGADLARVWVDAGRYYASLDPGEFRVPDHEGLADGFDEWLSLPHDDTAFLVATDDGRVVGYVDFRLERPVESASRQLLRELGVVRAVVDAIVVERAAWRRGFGRALLRSAEAWAREQGAALVTLDTYAESPVSIPFYEAMGYRRRSIRFVRRLG